MEKKSLKQQIFSIVGDILTGAVAFLTTVFLLVVLVTLYNRIFN